MRGYCLARLEPANPGADPVCVDRLNERENQDQHIAVVAVPDVLPASEQAPDDRPAE